MVAYDNKNYIVQCINYIDKAYNSRLTQFYTKCLM